MKKIFLNKFFLYFLCGSTFGIYNEFYFQEMWNYDQVLSPFVWKDIPLISLPGWGLFTILILWLSDIIQSKLKDKLFLETVRPILIDVFLFVLFMTPLEFICSRAGLWNYISFLHRWPPTMIFGYILAAALISSFARRIVNIAEQYRYKKELQKVFYNAMCPKMKKNFGNERNL